MTFELFEDVDLPAVPFQSWSLPFGGTNNFGVLLPVGAWQDLNGSVRFGVTDGSVLIDSLTFVVSRYEVGSQTQIEVFKTVVSPIPEPTVLVFLVVGAFTCLPRTTWSTRQRIEMTGAQRSVIPIRG
jgi:hypothetical protein